MYKYGDLKQKIFTEQGQVIFLKIRDRVNDLLNAAGAVKMENAIQVTTDDLWQRMACVDRMVELEELKEMPSIEACVQDRVFIRGHK